MDSKKLQEQKAKAIIAYYNEHPYTVQSKMDLAIKYDLAPYTVHTIYIGVCWKDIPRRYSVIKLWNKKRGQKNPGYPVNNADTSTRLYSSSSV